MSSQNSASKAPPRLDALDGLRGLVTLIVVLFHIEHVLFLRDLYDSSGLVGLWAVLGFFFALSGFLLTMLYGQRLTDGRSVADFVVRRAGRIWPMHLFTLGLLFFWELIRAIRSVVLERPDIVTFVADRSVWELFRNVFLAHGWGIGRDYSWNSPSWTLSTELVGYAVFVLITLSIKRVDMRAIAAFSIAVISGAVFVYHTELVKWWTARVPWCLQGFFLGYLVCWAWQRWPIRSRLVGGAIEIGSVTGCLLALIVGIDGLPAFLLWWVCMAGVVYSVANESSIFSRMLAWKPLRWLGDISLSVYLMHFPLILVINQVFRTLARGGALGAPVEPNDVFSLGPVWVNIAFTIAFMAVAIALGALGHYYVDGPCRDRLGRLSARIKRGRGRLAKDGVVAHAREPVSDASGIGPR